jgi:hypothetical protein
MKQVPLTLLTPVIFFGMLLAYTKIVGPLPLSVSSVVTQKSDVYVATGEGKTTVVPDQATVSVGVQTQGQLVGTVQKEMNEKVKAMTQAIKRLGVDDKDIKTSGYSIYPSYDYQNSKPRIVGYQASTALTVKIKNLDLINSVIDTATSQGANTVSGVTLEVSDKAEALKTAREMAVAEAKKKADQAAQIAGFTLGKIINYQEQEGGVNYPVPMLAKAEMSRDAAGGTTSIEPGSQEVHLSVSISYNLE